MHTGTLCYCPNSGDLSGNATFPELVPDNALNRTCGASGAKLSELRLFNNSADEAFGPSLTCRCGPDPFLEQNPSWIMCKCPKISFCTFSLLSDTPCPDDSTISSPPAPPKEEKIPDSTVYTHFKNNDTSPPLGAWPWCEGEYALCSMANCTTDFVGKDTSDLGPQLAECGCITATSANGLTKTNLVDPTYILSDPLYQGYQNDCSKNASACAGPNASQVCKAIITNTIYKGQYDLTSTYNLSPQLGGFQVQCSGPGRYAQCMTAACYKSEAFDGSPVTCYCPVYETTSDYVVGGAWGSDIPCTQPEPYLLSGVAG